MKPYLTILVVDQSPAVRRAVQTILGAAGHQVLLTAGASEALGILEGQRPDLIVTGYALSAAGGLEFVRQVRDRPEFDATPIFVISGEAGLVARSRMAVAGANAWIASPIRPTILVSAVAAAAVSLARPLASLHHAEALALAG